MAYAVQLALSKIDSCLANEDTMDIVAKVSEKFKNLKGLHKVEKIKTGLKVINNAIMRISTEDLKNYVVKAWIAEVQALAYRVQDVMDKYSYHAVPLEEEEGMKKLFVKTQYDRIFDEIAEELTLLERKIINAESRYNRWLSPFQLNSSPLVDIDRNRPQYQFLNFVPDEDLVGIEENRQMLTQWLYCDEPEHTVITVSGMGGLGKTTLVANVYEREKMNFTTHSWIVVSQTYTITNLLKEMLTKIGYQEQVQLAELDIFDLKEKLKEKLKHGRCLIVLDDVWDREAYTQIFQDLQDLQTCRIIITTRQEHVAAVAHPVRQLKLKPLGQFDAFDLFCRVAFFGRKGHKCPAEIVEIATSIVSTCRGLPLALASVGASLSTLVQTKYVWTQKYNQLRSVLANNDSVQAILSLGYHALPGDLRNCILYCSLFPEDFQLPREILVRLWVAEGFAVQKENNTAEDIAEGNLMELIHRNMLEVVEYDELGRVSTCKMHVLVRDLAISIAKEEMFGFADDVGTMLLMDREIHRLSCEWRDQTVLQVKFPLLRTVVSVAMAASSPKLLSSIFSESSYLTVLELQDSEITKVPESIGNLSNLRYIGLRRTKVKSLPGSIGKLSNLQTLDIKQTKIEKLPRGLVKIKKLRHLLADRLVDEKETEFQYFVGVQAPKELSNLEELQTLETVGSSKDLPSQLMKLMQLRTLWIDNINAADCAHLFTTISDMPLLSSLLLSAKDEHEALCFEALKPQSTYLHRLIIRGQWAMGTLDCPIFCGHGAYLRYLSLSWCHLGEDPLGMLALWLPNLVYLSLNRIHSGSSLILSADSFPNLQTLVLKRMPDVNQLVIMEGALPSIVAMYIVSLPKLDSVPEGIESIHSLKKLWLLSLHKDFRTQWETNGMHQKMVHVPELRV